MAAVALTEGMAAVAGLRIDLPLSNSFKVFIFLKLYYLIIVSSKPSFCGCGYIYVYTCIYNYVYVYVYVYIYMYMYIYTCICIYALKLPLPPKDRNIVNIENIYFSFLLLIVTCIIISSPILNLVHSLFSPNSRNCELISC